MAGAVNPIPIRTALVLAAALCAVVARAQDADWKTFKQAFFEDGRIVDTGQGRITHSEAQGYGMVLAVHHGDRAAFDQLWQWTQKNLQVRDDKLMAWKWEPQKRAATDKNNAADGDLLIAWALVRAGGKWQCADCTAAGQAIAQDVRKKLLKRVPHGLVLLPGIEGFDKPDAAVVNLSYWVFPAIRDLARADPAPEWEELAATGVALLGYSYFGRWALPPDWLRLGEKVAPADNERFGYDAVRIPVYLIWGRKDTPALLKSYRDFWGNFTGARWVPSFTNLKDDSVDSRDAEAGIRAIAQLVAEHPNAKASRLPALDARQSYYQAVLLLLCKMALAERGSG